MRWEYLGPLRVTDDAGGIVRIPAGRVSVLLATLLVRPNQAVSIDELSEYLWDGAPPPGSARTVRVYAVRLRRALGPTAAERIVTQAPGYLCRVGRDELDLLRFEGLCDQAGNAARARDWVRAGGLLAEALALWRGTPLADVPSELLRSREVARLEQLRIQAVEDHVYAELHLNRHEHLIPRLRELTYDYPLREHLHAQLIRALSRTGRRAEALEVYRHIRRVLVEQLGIEPGSELRDLHQRILAGKDEPAAGPPAETAPRPTSSNTSVPRQLPAAARHFTGRRQHAHRRRPSTDADR